jgi:hypothetical protein
MNLRVRLSRLEAGQPVGDPPCRCPFSMEKVREEIRRGHEEGGLGPSVCADCGGRLLPINWVREESA